MDLQLNGRVALVAGASKGLGYATAELLVGEGARVVICSRDQTTLSAAEARLRALGRGEVASVVADVSTTEGCEGFVQTALDRFGTVDMLVCNSGGPRPGRFDEVTSADWSSAVDLLLHSAVRLTRLVLPAMRTAGGGSIVYITGFGVKAPGLITELILSAALRTAVTGMARALATDLAREGVRINCVLPGRIATDRLIEIEQRAVQRGEGTAEEIRDRGAREIPLGRVGTPHELAAAVVFLLSERAAFITGQALVVDGGQVPSL